VLFPLALEGRTGHCQKSFSPGFKLSLAYPKISMSFGLL
jgi:hypothetical protein